MAEGTAAQATPEASKAELPKGAPAPGAAPAVKAEEATEVIKVNGKDVKVTPAQLRVLAQKGYFADQKLKSVDVLTGRTAGLIQALKTPEGVVKLLNDKTLGNSPKAVLKALLSSEAIDDEVKEDLSKWVYENVVKKAKLSPEEVERDQKLKDYERLKNQEKDRQQRELSEKQKAEVSQVYQAIRGEVVKQIKEDKSFPQEEGAIRQVIDKLRVMNRQGVKITPEAISKAVGMAKKSILLHQQTMFDSIEDPEELIKFFGEARALKISKALVTRLKNKGKVKAEGSEKPVEKQDDGKITDRIEKKFGTNKHGYAVMEI